MPDTAADGKKKDLDRNRRWRTPIRILASLQRHLMRIQETTAAFSSLAVYDVPSRPLASREAIPLSSTSSVAWLVEIGSTGLW
jgi:hypothetical protein